jgi:hypothetical protein
VHEDIQVFLVVKDQLDQKVIREISVHPDQKDLRVFKDLGDLKVFRDHPDVVVILDLVDVLDRKVIEVKRVIREMMVLVGHRDLKDQLEHVNAT